MVNVISNIRSYLDKKIGRCAHCMRQAFTFSLATWALFGAGILLLPGSPLITLVGIAALALSMLWLLHVGSHARRATTNVDMQPANSGEVADRRQVLGTFLRAAGIGFLVSVPVVSWSSAALAFCGQCTINKDCGVGWSCKNTAAYNEDVCNECVQD